MHSTHMINQLHSIVTRFTAAHPAAVDAPEVTLAALRLSNAGHEATVIDYLNDHGQDNPVIANALRTGLLEASKTRRVQQLRTPR